MGGQEGIGDVAEVGDARRGEDVFESVDLRFFRCESGIIGVGKEPESMTIIGKSKVGVIFSQAEAEFGGRRRA